MTAEFVILIGLVVIIFLDLLCRAGDATINHARSISFLSEIAFILFIPIAFLWMLIGICLRWKRRTNEQRLGSVGMLALLVGIVFMYLWLPIRIYAADIGARYHVNSVSSETKLQAWAETLLGKPRKQWPYRWPYLSEIPDPEQIPFPVQLDRRKLPDFVRRIPVDNNPYVFVNEDEDRQRYITIPINVGWLSWGVVVGNRSFKPSPEMLKEEKLYFRWRDGVYGWQDKYINLQCATTTRKAFPSETGVYSKERTQVNQLTHSRKADLRGTEHVGKAEVGKRCRKRSSARPTRHGEGYTA